MKNTIAGKFQAVALSGIFLVATGCWQKPDMSKDTARTLRHMLSADSRKEGSLCELYDRAGQQLIQNTMDVYSEKANIRFELLRNPDGSYAPDLVFNENSRLDMDLINPENHQIDQGLIEDLQESGCEMTETSAAYNAFDLGMSILRTEAIRHQMRADAPPPGKARPVLASLETPPDRDLNEACAVAVKNDAIPNGAILILPPVYVYPDDNEPPRFAATPCNNKKPRRENRSGETFRNEPEKSGEEQFEPWQKVKKSGCDAHECRI
ncbi:MAG: hypothetical protein DYH13_09050 [Alphaproteobacteria bacterium PRO2]|nr:hypothetical protein [Alphaproteobacteria bacterium PRO2]